MDLIRQEGILPASRLCWAVTVIGAGGIGNPAVLTFAKMGFEEIHLFDRDKIELHNISTQLLYGPGDVGKWKVDVAQERVLALTGVRINAHRCTFPTKRVPCAEGIYVSGVHTMRSRRRIWAYIAQNFAHIPLYIDGRTGVGPTGQWLQVYTVRPAHHADAVFYQQHLHSDRSAAREFGCGQFFPVNMVNAAHIASQVQKWIMREPYFAWLAYDLATNTLVRAGERRTPKKTSQEKGGNETYDTAHGRSGGDRGTRSTTQRRSTAAHRYGNRSQVHQKHSLRAGHDRLRGAFSG